MSRRSNNGSAEAGIFAAALGAGLFFGIRAAVRAARKMDLRGKVEAITGGSRGLGLVLARTFADEGAKVALLARDERELADAEIDLRRRGAAAHTEVCDVTDQSQVENAVERITARFEQIDVLVNNAGSIQVGPMEVMT